MARRKDVLLVQDVLKLGNMGDVVRVSPGYARNYLFPYALAIPSDAAHKRQIDVLREKAAKSEAEREVKARAQAKTMQGVSIQIAARVSHGNELFGSIGTKELVAALAKSGVEVDGKQIHLHDKLKKLGKYQIDVRLHKNVAVEVTLEIVNSDPNAPTMTETLASPAAPKADAEAKPAKGDKAEKGEKSEKPAKGDKAEKAEKGEKSEKSDKPKKTQKA
ncbi:MAG: 50S ribosomal protein L9 [Planctomycetes bacterium]|jgi:large subunit ribosomal protein L9|nr:50S ribosomal protein L9 [Planctomycetota bacterium]